MNRDKAEHKRKILWINPQFQSKFIFLTLVTTLVIIAVGLLSNWFFVWKFIQFGKTFGLPEGHDYFKFIYKQQATLNLIFLGSSILIMIASSIYGLVMSNKIAGPIYRIQRDLERRALGQAVDRVEVRKGDFFQELTVAINAVLLRSHPTKVSSVAKVISKKKPFKKVA